MSKLVWFELTAFKGGVHEGPKLPAVLRAAQEGSMDMAGAGLAVYVAPRVSERLQGRLLQRAAVLARAAGVRWLRHRALPE
jgi:hypothetical protein